MFHWICPECGREMAPAAKKCSVCGWEPAAAPAAMEAATAPLLLEAPKVETIGITEAPDLRPEPRFHLAPLQDYSPAASRVPQTAAPDLRILMPGSGPRVTLPGPALPPELASFRDINLATVLRDEPRSKKSAGALGWVASFVATLAMLGSGVVAAGHFTIHAPVPIPVVPLSTHPLAQSIEATGFRIADDLKKQPEIHYLLVNHSASELSGMTLYVTLQSSKSRPGQPPLCHFSFRSPVLGPFESKEMTGIVEKAGRSTVLPEWQDLRAEIQVAP